MGKTLRHESELVLRGQLKRRRIVSYSRVEEKGVKIITEDSLRMKMRILYERRKNIEVIMFYKKLIFLLINCQPSQVRDGRFGPPPSTRDFPSFFVRNPFVLY